MKYLMLIYGDESRWASIPPEQMGPAMEAWFTYTKELAASGYMLGGEALKPVATATTVRLTGGKVGTTDGPFAETKEQLGGYYLLEVPSLDEAITWAGKCPGAAYGSIELRPIDPLAPSGEG